MTKLSIIIPVLNEVETIEKLLLHLDLHLSKAYDYEIICVDGGSTDGTLDKLSNYSDVISYTSKKGRAKQMNFGARNATGSLLYFLHSDSFPPKNFDKLIIESVQKGHLAGCFRLRFDYQHLALQVTAWFTRINHLSCRGGDQSLFITKVLFDEIDGFDESYTIYEDNEIIKRLYAKKQFVVLHNYITTSARKYQTNGVWRLHYHFGMIHLKRRLGHSVESLQAYYQKHIK